DPAVISRLRVGFEDGNPVQRGMPRLGASLYPVEALVSMSKLLAVCFQRERGPVDKRAILRDVGRLNEGDHEDICGSLWIGRSSQRRHRLGEQYGGFAGGRDALKQAGGVETEIRMVGTWQLAAPSRAEFLAPHQIVDIAGYPLFVFGDFAVRIGRGCVGP